jgi:hypothetical protein
MLGLTSCGFFSATASLFFGKTSGFSLGSHLGFEVSLGAGFVFGGFASSFSTRATPLQLLNFQQEARFFCA